MRSRLTLTVDNDLRLLVMRYIGDIEGEQINFSMMEQLSAVDQPWTYDSLVDLRRHDGLVTAEEIQELGLRWAMLAQGRDKGRLIAIISTDPLVRARLSGTQGAFPFRVINLFETFDEGLDWIKAHRGPAQAVA